MNIKHKRIERVRHSIHSTTSGWSFWRYISGTLLERAEGASAGTNAFSFMLEMSGRGCTSPEKKKKLTWTWKPKHARMNFGGFNWMNPNHYMKNGCFTIAIHLKKGCLGFQGYPKWWALENAHPRSLTALEDNFPIGFRWLVNTRCAPTIVANGVRTPQNGLING